MKNGYFTDIIHFNETPIFDKVASSILIFKFVKSKAPQTQTNKIKIVKYLSTQRLTDEILTKIKDGLPDKKIERFERDQFLPKEIGRASCRERV